jgi:hypothetical protein
MGLYQKHHLRSAYDLAKCLSVLKKNEELNLEYENSYFRHPTQYFVRWIDKSTFYFKVLKFGEGGGMGTTYYYPRFQYLVSISGSEKEPIFTIQRKLGYHDYAYVFIFVFVAISFAVIFHAHRVVGIPDLVSCFIGLMIFFCAAFFPLAGEPGYDVFKKEINAVEINAV